MQTGVLGVIDPRKKFDREGSCQVQGWLIAAHLADLVTDCQVALCPYSF